MAAVPPSALSVAAQGVVTAIHTHFRKSGAKLHVSTDTPIEGAKQAANDTNVINLFFYRVAPSGFHAAQTVTDPMMIRVFCLVTPFAAKNAGGANQPSVGESDLRILGEVLRLFHEHPVLGPLTTPGGAIGTAYALQVVLQDPDMEEINHIWTALGGNEAYRPSAVYEFALIPFDPVLGALSPPPAYGHSAEVDPHLRQRDQPIGAPAALDAWSPTLFFVAPGEGLNSTLTLTWSAAQFANNPPDPVEIALSGVVGQSAVLVWQRQIDGVWQEVHTGPAIPVTTVRIDDAAARSKPALPAIAEAQILRLAAWPADAADQPIVGARPSNTLTLTVALQV